MPEPVEELDKVVAVATSTLELQRVSQELGEVRNKLAEERRRREEDLDRRLENLDNGQLEILRKIDGVKEKKVDLERFEDLEQTVHGMSKFIWIGIGIAITVSTGIPIAMHFIFIKS